MFAKIKQDFETGLQKLQWFCSLFHERLNIEISVFRLLHEQEELKKRKTQLLALIGQQVYDCRNADINIYSLTEVKHALKEIHDIDIQINDVAYKVQELSKVTSS